MLDKILQTLMFKKNIKPAQLARETNVPKQTLSRIVSGKSPNPHHKNLEPLADFFGVSVAQLKGEENLPSDFVDIHLPNSKPKPKTLPIVQWEQLTKLDKLDSNSVEDTLLSSQSLGDNAFAVSMTDTSMEPMFRKDSVLVFDPDKEVIDRSFVLVKLQSVHQVIFRQLIVDADHRYLKAMSPDFDAFPMRLMGDEDSVLGALVEARQLF